MDLKEIQQEMRSKQPPERLAWAAERFNGRIVFASSLGGEDQVITHMIATERLDIPIFTLDTGRLFQETLELITQTEARYGLRIAIYVPDRERLEAMVNRHGLDLYLTSVELRKQCCEVRKLEPLRRALAGNDAWVCGLRRSQAITRGTLQAVDRDEVNGLIKINPLIDWNEEDVWSYIHANKVPHNRLHDKGFPSIGCACCTRAVGPGEDIRKGRWWWEDSEHKECGLHRRGDR